MGVVRVTKTLEQYIPLGFRSRRQDGFARFGAGCGPPQLGSNCRVAPKPCVWGNVAWIVWLRPRLQFRAPLLSIQEFQVLQASPILLTVDVSRDEK